MDFTKDAVHEEIRSAVAQICKDFPDDYWLDKDNKHEFPWEFYNALVKGGWLGLTVPEEYGGGGMGVTEVCIVEQAIAASGAGMNGCSSVHIGMFGFEPILRFGSDSIKQRFLPRFATGELHMAFAVTEPDAGTDTTGIKTFATKVDGGWSITGKKVWISKAQEAERMMILCRTTPRDQCVKRSDGMTVFFATLDPKAVTIRPIEKLGRHAVDSNELFIDNLFVADEDIIGEVDKGFKVILPGLNAERVISANAAIGIGRAAIRRATDYANQRIVFGRPIGQNQGIAFPLAEANMALDLADLMCQKVAWMLDNGQEDCGREANTAKYAAAEAAFAAADAAITTLGGYGYAKEYHVERYFREARLMRIAPISQPMVLNYISEHVLGLPRSY